MKDAPYETTGTVTLTTPVGRQLLAVANATATAQPKQTASNRAETSSIADTATPSAAPTASSSPATAGPSPKCGTSTTSPCDQSFMAWGACIILILALLVAFTQPGRFGDSRILFFRSAFWRFLQTAIIGLIVVFVFYDAYEKGPNMAEVGGAVVTIILMAMLPFVSKVIFPGGSGELDIIADVVPEVRDLDTQTRLANLALATAGQIIAQAASNIATQFGTGLLDPKAKAAFAKRCLLETTDTISAQLRPPTTNPGSDVPPPAVPTPTADATAPAVATMPPEALRISAWISADDGKTLSFAAGWPLDATDNLSTVTMTVGADPASTVFRTGDAFNFPTLPESQRPPAPQGASFGGIALLPLVANGKQIGVFFLERAQSISFGGAQLAIAKALTALYALALGG